MVFFFIMVAFVLMGAYELYELFGVHEWRRRRRARRYWREHYEDWLALRPDDSEMKSLRW